LMVLLLVSVGTSCTHCPLEYVTVRQYQCPACKEEMAVYVGRTRHECEVRRDGR
jgi:hypothetical protein